MKRLLRWISGVILVLASCYKTAEILRNLDEYSSWVCIGWGVVLIICFFTGFSLIEKSLED